MVYWEITHGMAAPGLGAGNGTPEGEMENAMEPGSSLVAAGCGSWRIFQARLSTKPSSNFPLDLLFFGFFFVLLGSFHPLQLKSQPCRGSFQRAPEFLEEEKPLEGLGSAACHLPGAKCRNMRIKMVVPPAPQHMEDKNLLLGCF